MNDTTLLHQATLKTIARKVKELRTDRRLTQEELSQRAGLGPRHLQKIEAAQVNVTVHSLVKLAMALGVDISALFLDGNHSQS